MTTRRGLAGVLAAVSALLAAIPAAHAAGGVAVLASLPPFPAHIGNEHDCQALAEASMVFRAQAQQLRAALDAEAAAAQQQLAQGRAQMDVAQALQYAQYSQENQALDPDSHYCRSRYFPVDAAAVQAGQTMLAGLRAAGKTAQAAVDGCPRDDYTAHAERCTRPLVETFEEAKQQLIGPYIGALVSVYALAQGKAKQCVAMNAGLNAQYAPRAKGVFRYSFDPRLADAAAAGMAAQLTDEAHGRCMDIVRVVQTVLPTLIAEPMPPPSFDFLHPED